MDRPETVIKNPFLRVVSLLRATPHVQVRMPGVSIIDVRVGFDDLQENPSNLPTPRTFIPRGRGEALRDRRLFLPTLYQRFGVPVCVSIIEVIPALK